MKTTLEVFCAAMGWQGGTIHDAMRRFAVSDLRTMDRVCGHMADNIGKVSDPGVVKWFLNHRNEAIGLHTVAVAVRS